MQFDAAMTIVDAIYEAALMGADWNGVLTGIADLAGVETAALVIADPRIGLSSVSTPRADPDVVERYTRTWWQKDVTAAATCAAPVGALTSLHDTGRDRFFASDFYNDFWRTSGLGAERMAMNLATDNGAFASIVLQASRQRDEVDGDTARILRALGSHLIRAVALQRKMRLTEYHRDLALASPGRPGCGAILVDAEGRVILADAGAEDLMRTRTDITLDHDTLHLGRSTDTIRLYRLIASCTSDNAAQPRGGVLKTPPSPGGTPLHIDVAPYCGQLRQCDLGAFVCPPPAAIILIDDPGRRQAAIVQTLQETFGLTPAESAFAIEILKGDGREAAAARLGISLSTARTHLSRIFEKTGVNRQAELVRILSANGLSA